MPPPIKSTDLLDLIRKSGVMTAEQLAEFQDRIGELPPDPTRAASQLVKLGYITPFQAKLLLSGRYKGFLLGPYVIREQIGQGGMGAVYLAHHQSLKRPVAVKVLSPGSGANKLAVERFLREARAAAALDHPNIVRLFDVGKQEELHYLVMEFVDGQTLDKILENSGAIAAGKSVEYIMQVAAGLQHAHEKGFVHRDIKPSNLILGKDGTIKILDMGLARNIEANDKLTEILDNGAVVGTADYISPEQAMNHPVDIRSDIYSLGATLFTLVTGRTLYEGNTTQKLLQHQMKAPPSLSAIDRTLPPGLAKIVGRMLAKNPDDRPQTPADVIAELVPWLPTNNKVVASLSRTDLNSSPKLRQSLERVVANSSTRLNLDDEGSEPNDVKPEAKSQGPLPLILGLLGVLFLAILGVVIVYFAGLFGNAPNTTDTSTPATAVALPTGNSTPTTSTIAPPTSTAIAPPTTTPPTLKPAPLPVKPITGVLYESDFSQAKLHSETGSSPTITTWQAKEKGSASFPIGWRPRTLTPTAEAKFAIAKQQDKLVFCLENLKETSAAIETPGILFPSTKVLLTLEAQAATEAGYLMVSYRSAKGEETRQVLANVFAQPGKWTSEEVSLELPAAGFGSLIIQSSLPKGSVYLQSIRIRQADYAPAEKQLWAMNLANQQSFVQRSAADPGAKVPVKILNESGPGKMPVGWYRWVERANSEVEFFADGLAGKMAFGIRTISGEPGVMATLPRFNVPSGNAKVRVVYQAGMAGAVLRFRPVAPKESPAIELIKFTPTGGAWRLAIIDLVVAPGTAGLFELYNTASGPEGAVRLRELVVTE